MEEASVITVFEDRRRKVQLTPSQAEDILAFRNVLGDNHLSYDYDGNLSVSHYVGFISNGRTCLQILPKVYENMVLHSRQEQREAMKGLLHLLRVSEFNRILQLPGQASTAAVTELLELFIRIFADRIIETYQRQMNQEYLEITENSHFMKGKIDFNRNMYVNPVRQDRHVISYQSYEQNNLLNNIIKTVCRQLVPVTAVPANKRRLMKALCFLDAAEEIKLDQRLIESVTFNRLNRPFQPVYEMARMFFFNVQPESFQGNDVRFSFLVPLNELFEYYLYKLCAGIGNGIQVDYQRKRTFLRDDMGREVFAIRPDLLIHHGERLLAAADAKYKNPGYSEGKYKNISPGDLYQILAYAHAWGVAEVLLVYPQFDADRPPEMVYLFSEQDTRIKIRIICIDIREEDEAKNREVLAAALDLDSGCDT